MIYDDDAGGYWSKYPPNFSHWMNENQHLQRSKSTITLLSDPNMKLGEENDGWEIAVDSGVSPLNMHTLNTM